MTCVTWYVLLADLVSRAVDPVFGISAMVAKNFRVNFLGSRQSRCLLLVPLKLHPVDLFSSSTRNTDFTIDAAGSLAKEIVFSGNMARVAGEVFPCPSSWSLVRGEAAGSCLLECLVCHLLIYF